LEVCKKELSIFKQILLSPLVSESNAEGL